MNLHTISVGAHDAPRTGFVLHGILGSAKNWLSFARRLVEQAPDLRLLLVDLRCHGASHGPDEPHTIAACSTDLMALENALGRPVDLVIGHSFGGKVALQFAAHTQEVPRWVWVLDTIPAPLVPPPTAETSFVLEVITSLRAIQMPLAERADVVKQLTALGLSRQIGLWMTTNLRRTEAGFVWCFDLDGIEALLMDYYRLDGWRLLANASPGQRIEIVRAERSDLWDSETRGTLEKLASNAGLGLHLLKDTGHWVHIDNPDGLLDLICQVPPPWENPNANTT